MLLYQLLVGRHPTAPDGGATHAAMLRALAEQEPPRPSDVASQLRAAMPTPAPAGRAVHHPRSAARACRGDLDTIVAKALKKDPAERYQTVTAFAEDMRRHLRREPVTARPDSVWYRARSFAARHRLELGAAAAVVLALVVGTGIALRQARASARERDRALERLRRAEATNDFSSFLLSQARPRGKPISNTELLAGGEALIERRFARDPALRVHLLLTLAGRYQENQQFDDWRRVLQRAYDVSRRSATWPARPRDLRVGAAVRRAGRCGQGAGVDRRRAAARRLQPRARRVRVGCRVLESIAARLGGDAAAAVVAAERAMALEERRGPECPGREIEGVAALARAGPGIDYTTADAAIVGSTAMLESRGSATRCTPRSC